MYAGDYGDQKRVLGSLVVELLRVVSCWARVLETKSGPLEEHQVHLTAKPSFKPHNVLFQRNEEPMVGS